MFERKALIIELPEICQYYFDKSELNSLSIEFDRQTVMSCGMLITKSIAPEYEGLVRRIFKKTAFVNGKRKYESELADKKFITKYPDAFRIVFDDSYDMYTYYRLRCVTNDKNGVAYATLSSLESIKR